jgi:hypothetical protein
MNDPLNQNGWKVCQAAFEPLTNLRTGQPRTATGQELLGRCHFRVVSDPGMLVKISGSALMILGLLVMFVMRPRWHALTGA